MTQSDESSQAPRFLIALAATLVLAWTSYRLYVVLAPPAPATVAASQPAATTKPARPRKTIRPATRPVVVASAEDPTTAPTDPTDAEFQAQLEQAFLEWAAANEPIVPLNVARSAAHLVGVDPWADFVWETAISDPMLTPADRASLIAALHQNGFADPTNVTVEELPLVLKRIELIERLSPDAIDAANATAFGQTYQSLTAMADRLAQ